MENKEKPKDFIERPVKSGKLVSVSLIVGFIILVINQWLLFRVLAQKRIRTAITPTEKENSEVVHVSSDVQLISDDEDDFTDAVALIRPAIVNIDVTSANAGNAFRRGTSVLNFDMPTQPALISNMETLGSGIIVNAAGYVLTCYHLIHGRPEVYVTLLDASHKTYKAELAGANPENNLAILKISTAAPLPAAELGNSDMVRITDPVACIGSPFGFEHTITSGIISGDKRDIVVNGTFYTDMLQTDAAINRGSAGGALIDCEGRLIGVNSAIISASDFFSGISFAIPINKARQLMFETIKEY